MRIGGVFVLSIRSGRRELIKKYMRIKFMVFSSLFLIISSASIFLAYDWFVNRQKQVLAGAANPIFPFSEYTSEQLKKIHGYDREVVVQQTASQTYIKLKKYLSAGKVEQLSGLFSNKYRQEYMNIFYEAEKNGRLDELNEKLESDLKKIDRECFVNSCTYIMQDSRAKVDFVRDNKGTWLIESI